jgi:hypothetical protein
MCRYKKYVPEGRTENCQPALMDSLVVTITKCCCCVRYITSAADICGLLRTQKCGSSFLSHAPQFPEVHCFLEGPQSSPVCPSGKNNVKMKASMEHCWNDTDRGRQKYWEKNSFHFHSIHHKAHTGWLVIEFGPLATRY